MIKSYFKIALRILRKQKVFTVINIAGLSVGMACAIFIFLWVLDELSYDRYHVHTDRIFRVIKHAKGGDKEYYTALSPTPLAQALKSEFPEILEATRISDDSPRFFRYEDKGFNESRVVFADANVFKVFTIPLLSGDPETALSKPRTMIITQSMAQKYFGDENPLGKTLQMDDNTDILITGVAEDIPHNSHFHYDFIGSFVTFSDRVTQEWLFPILYTYVLLKDGVDPAELDRKLIRIIEKYYAPHYPSTFGFTYEEDLASGGFTRIHLQPITDIHLHSHMIYEIEPNGDVRYIMVFSIIAIFILLIACINFMNLTTARSSIRAREVGMRKVLGSRPTQLMRQFLVESTLLSFFSLGIALALVEIFFPLFNRVSAKDIDPAFFSHLQILPAVIGIILIVGILAGVYPAFFLTSFRPISVLRGKLQAEIKSPFVRNGLVLFQFSISIVLLVGTFVVYSQMLYVRNKQLGFDKEHIVIIPRAHVLGQSGEAFKQELIVHSGIQSASISSSYPGRGFAHLAYKRMEAPAEDTYAVGTFITDHDFVRTFGLSLVEGRYFSADPSKEKDTVVLNETGARLLELKNPVGQRIWGPEKDQYKTLTVIGILKDSYFYSLHQKIQPIGIRHLTAGGTITRFLCVRLNPGNIERALAFLKDKWEEFVPGRPFEYMFLDEDLDRLYKSDWRTGHLMSAFSVLSIIIACLGLFGLVAFSAEQRTKEIGLRKVLGASSTRIIFAFSKEFAKWVILANVFAWPVAYFVMSKWLDNFAYRTRIALWTFVLSAILTLLISLVTITFKVGRASRANPVDSLRYE